MVALVRDLIRRSEIPPPQDSRPLLSAILNNCANIPAEAFAKLPTDGAAQVNHYLYGHPKRY